MLEPLALSSGLPTGAELCKFRRQSIDCPTLSSYVWPETSARLAATWLEIWLEAGREGRVFTYANPDATPVGIGDLVRVRLQGRRQSGLVVGLPAEPPEGLDPARLLPIEGVVQAAAVDPQWRALIEAVADRCHTSAFKTLRSALPPGWLGNGGGASRGLQRPRWQVVLCGSERQGNAAHLGERQRALLEVLQQRGGR